MNEKKIQKVLFFPPPVKQSASTRQAIRIKKITRQAGAPTRQAEQKKAQKSDDRLA
jgi:hypothetical protein